MACHLIIHTLLCCLIGALNFGQVTTIGQESYGYVYWRNATRRTIGSVVPKPKHISHPNGLDYLEIAQHDFELVLDNIPTLQACKSVQLVRQRYAKGHLLFDDSAPQDKDNPDKVKRRRLGQLLSVKIGAIDANKFKCQLVPHADIDEAYTLSVVLTNNSKPEAKLDAYTNWGLLRGLETLSQLIFQIDAEHGATFAIQPVLVADEPRFKHRGFMLDTSRHYISLDKIMLLLDAMAYNKLNVFHWHIVDDQSFPLVSETYPQLTKRNAYRPKMIYTHNQVRSIIAYAALHGIRVVPELDTPGHSYPLRYIPNVLTECYDTKTNTKNGDFGPVDPTKANAYKSVNKLLAEFGRLFVDSHFHAGGDEVDFDCWKSSPEIRRWMNARNMSGKYEELSNYYIKRLHSMLTVEHHKTMLVWQEVFDMGADLPRDNVIVHVWKDINDKQAFMKHLNLVVSSGYNSLLSSCWYLNYIDYGQDWIKFYQCDPRGAPIDQTKAHQVLGGEICMWTEFVDDSNVLSRTWPRASAAAERLWSPIDVNDTQEFLNRLEQHRCRLLARGIDAEPVNGPGYC